MPDKFGKWFIGAIATKKEFKTLSIPSLWATLVPRWDEEVNERSS